MLQPDTFKVETKKTPMLIIDSQKRQSSTFSSPFWLNNEKEDTLEQKLKSDSRVRAKTASYGVWPPISNDSGVHSTSRHASPKSTRSPLGLDNSASSKTFSRPRERSRTANNPKSSPVLAAASQSLTRSSNSLPQTLSGQSNGQTTGAIFETPTIRVSKKKVVNDHMEPQVGILVPSRKGSAVFGVCTNADVKQISSPWKLYSSDHLNQTLQDIVGSENATNYARRLPASRIKIAELNHVLDEMLEEVRLAPLLSPVAFPTEEALKFGSLAALEGDSSEKGFDIILAQLVEQSCRKLQRVRKFYKHVNDSELESLRSALAAAHRAHDRLQTESAEHHRLHKQSSHDFKQDLHGLASTLGIEVGTTPSESGKEELLDILGDQLTALREEQTSLLNELAELRDEKLALIKAKELVEKKNMDLEITVLELNELLKKIDSEKRPVSKARYRTAMIGSLSARSRSVSDTNGSCSGTGNSGGLDAYLQQLPSPTNSNKLEDDGWLRELPEMPISVKAMKAESFFRGLSLDQILGEEAHMAKDLQSELNSIEVLIMEWANGVLFRAGVKEQDFITDFVDHLSNGIVYLKILKQLDLERGEKQEALEEYNRLMNIDDPFERCSKALTKIHGINEHLAKTVAATTHAPSQGRLFHCMMLGLILLQSYLPPSDVEKRLSQDSAMSLSHHVNRRSSEETVDTLTDGKGFQKRKKKFKRQSTGIGKRKEPMLARRMTFGSGVVAESRTNLLVAIGEIYQAKAAFDAKNADLKEKTLSVFTKEFISQKYGLPVLAEKALSSFTMGIISHQDHARVRLFAKMSGMCLSSKKKSKKKKQDLKKDQISTKRESMSSSSDSSSDLSDENEETLEGKPTRSMQCGNLSDLEDKPLHINAPNEVGGETEETICSVFKTAKMFNFFIRFVCGIISREKISSKLGGNEKFLVSRQQVDRAISKNFCHAEDMFNIIRSLKKELDTLNEGDSENGFVVSLDDALEQVMAYAPKELASACVASAATFKPEQISSMLRGIARRRSCARQGETEDSSEQQELRELFKEFDQNADGFLDDMELRSMLEYIDDNIDNSASQAIIEDTLSKVRKDSLSRTPGGESGLNLEAFLQITNTSKPIRPSMSIETNFQEETTQAPLRTPIMLSILPTADAFSPAASEKDEMMSTCEEMKEEKNSETEGEKNEKAKRKANRRRSLPSVSFGKRSSISLMKASSRLSIELNTARKHFDNPLVKGSKYGSSQNIPDNILSTTRKDSTARDVDASRRPSFSSTTDADQDIFFLESFRPSL